MKDLSNWIACNNIIYSARTLVLSINLVVPTLGTAQMKIPAQARASSKLRAKFIIELSSVNHEIRLTGIVELAMCLASDVPIIITLQFCTHLLFKVSPELYERWNFTWTWTQKKSGNLQTGSISYHKEMECSFVKAILAEHF